MKRFGLAAAVICVALGLVARAEAGAFVTALNPGPTTLPGNDDGFTGSVGIGFTLNYFGISYSSLFVNNNGNVTFTAPDGTFTPSAITSLPPPRIAPFFADVDTRVGNVVTYGTFVGGAGFEGKTSFVVNWDDVGYYFESLDKLNKFQLILQDRSDIAAGDFDIIFNYDKVQWETGDASGGSGGTGGVSAHVGYTNGAGTFYEFPGSGVNGAFLDGAGGASELITHMLNSTEPGRYRFPVRSGIVIGPDVPEPASMALLGIGGAALAGYRIRRRKLQAK